jgi:putative DNA primase/helicase
MTAWLDAAPVFPVSVEKWPLTEHGLLDATRDPEIIAAWRRRWPKALFAIATGEPSGVVALDIDMGPGVNGFDALEYDIGISTHPETPTAHTPAGGCHLLFKWPGRFVKTIAGKLGTGLDIRGDGGSLILPPGPGRSWDPHLGPKTPLADMPDWMVLAEPEPTIVSAAAPIRPQPISRYAEAALDGAVKTILGAPAGQQRDVLNKEIYSIARLVAGNVLPAGLAIESLQWAARRLRSYDTRRPWRPAELDKIVRGSFADGLARPRQPENRHA